MLRLLLIYIIRYRDAGKVMTADCPTPAATSDMTQNTRNNRLDTHKPSNHKAQIDKNTMKTITFPLIFFRFPKRCSTFAPAVT